MKLCFYRGQAPNFGDELSPWLMPKVFPNFFDDDQSNLFLGIGSIIYDDFPPASHKIVFGTGYGGYTSIPDLTQNWSFYCVRGPRTARACNLSLDKVAGDTAILIHRYWPRRTSAATEYAFMPHWQSVDRGNWKAACELAGIKFIDPAWPVEDVLAAIETSKALVTEAMHGAIVADALRVPWIPVLPIHQAHRMKWYDWAEALDIDLQPHRLWPSSAREATVAWGKDGRMRLQNPTGLLRVGVELADGLFIQLAADRLRKLTKMPFMQSADASFNRVLDKLENNADAILKDYPLG